MSETKGTRVTREDLTTGESESAVIENGWIVVCDGDRYLAGVQHRGNGTAVVTVKRRTEAAQ